MFVVVVIAVTMMLWAFTAEQMVYRASEKQESRLSKQFLGDHSNSWAIERISFMTEDNYIDFFMISKNTFENILIPLYDKHWCSQRHKRGSETKTSKRRRLSPKSLARRLWTAEELLAISLQAHVGLVNRESLQVMTGASETTLFQ